MSRISSKMQVHYLYPCKGRFDRISGVLPRFSICTHDTFSDEWLKSEETRGLNTPTRKVGGKDCLEVLWLYGVDHRGALRAYIEYILHSKLISITGSLYPYVSFSISRPAYNSMRYAIGTLSGISAHTMI